MIVDLPILESVKGSQSQHGLKYENYRNYRSYCSRRLHRIRRSLNVHQGIPPSAKARHQRGRKLMDINNGMVLEAGEKNQEYAERCLMIPLCLAERAWSYAMQLKQEVPEQPRRRFHLIRRLKKASEHAQRFEKLCHDPESPCSERTKKESVAYAGYITGLYQLESENWAEAKENLNKSLTIYFTLSVSIKNEDVLEHYRQRIEELRASIRFCQFNLQGTASKSNPKVKLPTTLQFHDLAFRHVQRLQEQTVEKVEDDAGKAEITAKKVEAPAQQSDQEGGQTDYESDEEEEFQETNEGETQQSQGVSGLVKGWLGRAWS